MKPRRSTQEEIISCHILQDFCCHLCRDLIVPSLATRLPKFHVQIPRNNKLRPPRRLCNFRLYVYDGCPVSRGQVTYHYVPEPLPRHHLSHNDVCAKLAYRLNCEDWGVPTEYRNAALVPALCRRRGDLIPCQKPQVRSLHKFNLLEEPRCCNITMNFLAVVTPPPAIYYD